MTYRFTVPGKPRGKGRPRFARQGNFVRTYTPQETAAYENLVALEFQNAGGKKLEGEVWVYVDAYFAPPKSTSKVKRKRMLEGIELPQSKPDADNILKAVLDGLNGVAWSDDKQVVFASVAKRYSVDARLQVTVRSEDEPF